MTVRETTFGIVALLALAAMAIVGAYLKIDIDAGAITMTIVTAIAALIRGDSSKRSTDVPKPDEPKKEG